MVTVYLAALRFFYTKTLKKGWSASATPYPKRAEHVPSILSQQEVARLIDAADNSFHRTLLMTLYATGVRRAELTHLKISDVDNQRSIDAPLGLLPLERTGLACAEDTTFYPR